MTLNLKKSRAELALTHPEFADLICDVDDTMLAHSLQIEETVHTIPEFQGNPTIGQAYERAGLIEEFCGFSSQEAEKIAFKDIVIEPLSTRPRPRGAGSQLSKSRKYELMTSLVNIIREESYWLGSFAALGKSMGATFMSARSFANYLARQI